jgi:cytochrome c
MSRRLLAVRSGTLFAALAAIVALLGPVWAELRGHGGPVRALAVAPDGRTAMSGSFDQSAILWSLERGAAISVLRFHEGAVNAALSLPDGRFVTGGEDGRAAIWQLGQEVPAAVVTGHSGPIAGLAVSPDGRLLASASWDGTARITPLDGGSARVLDGHRGPVNAVAFLADGRIVTAGYDATLRIWPTDGAPLVVTLPAPLNGVVATPDGTLIAAGADGAVRILDKGGAERAVIETGPTPVIALALSPDARMIAAASIAGAVAVIDRAEARLRFRLVGPGLPVWSLAFKPDGRELLTGGSDRMVRRWDLANGEPIGPVAMSRPDDFLSAFNGGRGAQVFQACAACHTLTPDGGNRAGPSLHGLFGRKIATAPGYNFSESFRRLDIIWTPETVAKLFEIGPQRFTPGTKMPEQVITDPADRAALVGFLERATRP